MKRPALHRRLFLGARRRPGSRRFCLLRRRASLRRLGQRRFRGDAGRRLRRIAAGHEGAGLRDQPARVQDADLGLYGRPGRRRTRRRRQDGDGQERRRAGRRRAALRRRPPRFGGDLGGRIQFRRGHGQAPAGAIAQHPRLFQLAAAGLFPRRADGDAENRRSRRHPARPPDRLVGGRLRADAIHALDLPASRRRSRRLGARHRRFGRRGARLDRQLSREVRLGVRASLGASR